MLALALTLSERAQRAIEAFGGFESRSWVRLRPKPDVRAVISGSELRSPVLAGIGQEMDTVYVLHHVRSDDDFGDDAKLIGVYRSADAAAGAVARLLSQSGFRDHPNGFQTDAYVLDRDHWSEGFGFG